SSEMFLRGGLSVSRLSYSSTHFFTSRNGENGTSNIVPFSQSGTGLPAFSIPPISFFSKARPSPVSPPSFAGGMTHFLSKAGVNSPDFSDCTTISEISRFTERPSPSGGPSGGGEGGSGGFGGTRS